MSSSMMHTHTRQSATRPMVATDVVFLASVVGFIISFFHWYGVSSAAGSITLNGWHDWGVAAAILFAVGALYSVRFNLNFSRDCVNGQVPIYSRSKSNVKQGLCPKPANH